MSVRSAVAAAALVVALAGAAHGGSRVTPLSSLPPPQRCEALKKQFDAALLTHAHARNVDAAKVMAALGAKLCGSKRYASGERRLVEALEDLGVKAII